MRWNDNERSSRLWKLLILGSAVLCVWIMACVGVADSATTTDAQGFVYDASGYFDSYGKTIVGYVGSAKTITIPSDVGAVIFQERYDYSTIETISLAQIQYDTEFYFYGSFPSLKKFVAPNISYSYFYVEEGMLFNRSYRDKIGYTNSPSIVKCPAGYSGSYTVPGTVEEIDSGCFRDCSQLKSVTVPDNITYIGSKAFMNCTALETVTLSNAVSALNENVFYNCKKLKQLYIPGSVVAIHSKAFYGCASLKQLRIPASVHSIDGDALDGLTCVFDVAKGSEAHKFFFYAGGGYSYTVDGKAPSTSDGGVSNGFTYFVKDNGKATIVDCDLKGDVIIPSKIAGITVDNLEEQLFFGADGITSVTIPNTVTYFGSSTEDNKWDYVFSYCDQLEAINVQAGNPTFCSVDGVLYLKDMKTLVHYPVAREGSVYRLPATTTTLCCTSFASCKHLKELYLTDKDVWWYGYTFSDTGNLTVYYRKGGYAEIKVEQVIAIGDYYEQDPTRNRFVVCDDAEFSKLILPTGLKTIEPGAFTGVAAMKIVVPASVTSIKSKAFSGCVNLAYLELPGGSISIADDILQGCGNVTIICPAGSAAEKWAKKNALTVQHK